MHFATLFTTAFAALAAAQAPGYNATFSTVPANSTFSFGQHYAVLNLDMINAFVSSLNTTQSGRSFIASNTKWINSVHQQTPSPLQIFTRIYFTTAQRPEISATTPFTQVVAGLGNITASSPAGQIYPAFHHSAKNDVVLQKTRYYAGAGNALEEILASQGIDTVVLSGIRTSGVIVSTAYRLFDLNYKVYVISGNVIETPPEGDLVNDGVLTAISKLPASIITLDQAIEALGRSGPAVY